MESESERKVQNTQYVPTKCRVTKPVPPKPATNPMQFVAVKPSPLLIKAQEINKRVEEIVKEARKEHNKEETEEDWQSNLDNWKSSRRKRQEHIIERVEEVKKLELQEKERGRSNCRRGSTFSEILEKRNKGGRFSIPIYDNDVNNDLSDYGIGSSSSKTNSIKDVDTDDNSSSGLDEKENVCDEIASPTTAAVQMMGHQDEEEEDKIVVNVQPGTQRLRATENDNGFKKSPANEQYTYEGAIEDYRSRICAKINLNRSPPELVKVETYKSKEFVEAQTLLPKGNLTQRRKMFEVQLNGYCPAPKHVEEEEERDDQLKNTQSIKERLQSFERSVEQQPSQTAIKTEEDLLDGNLKSRLTQFTTAATAAAEAEVAVAACDSDTKNNNMEMGLEGEESNAELSKLKLTTSSSDLVAASFSDKEDSGIQTTDVSCSVSQSDDVVEEGGDFVQQEAPNYYQTTTATFLTGEKKFAGRDWPQTELKAINSVEVYSSIVENIAKTMNDMPTTNYFEDGKILEIYDNTRDSITVDGTDLLLLFNSLASAKLQPPTEKPPPPPPLCVPHANDNNANHINSSSSPSMRTKKELLIKRGSSFLDSEEAAGCINKQLEQFEIQEHRRDIDGRHREHVFSRQLDNCQQVQETLLSTLPPPPNGCLFRGETRANDEIIKKEREIIEMIELEEQYKPPREAVGLPDKFHSSDITIKPSSMDAMEPDNDIYLGNKKFDEPFHPEPCNISFNDQEDSEVIRVEQELLQLEQEELKRKLDTQLFRDRSAAKLQSSNHATYENMYYDIYAKNGNTRKSMPELSLAGAMPESHTTMQHHASDEWGRHSKVVFNGSCAQLRQPIQPPPPLQLKQLMNVSTMRRPRWDGGDIIHPSLNPTHHRKSMPDLDRTMLQTGFKSNTANTSLLMPIQPMDDQCWYKSPHVFEPGHQRASSIPRPNLSHQSNAKWIKERRPQAKSYNEHWLYQEAELRRLADQRVSGSGGGVVQTHRHILANPTNANLPYLSRRPNPQTYANALPLSSYPQPTVAVVEDRDVILSVSGRKKCSYCCNELGRGAAMIIESLSLFYHMECFKCCVCHIQLGDGLMGTDVRVRNQKLHCHNCYSSDDGIKFSCV